MKAPSAVLTSVMLVLAVAPTYAAESKQGAARLEVTRSAGAEQCVDARALIRAVESRLQRRAFRPDRSPTLFVAITLSRAAEAGWSAEISLRDGSGALLGTRRITTTAPHCSSLDDSLALVIALLVDSPPTPVTDASAPRANEPKAEPTPPTAAAPSSEATPAPLPARMPHIEPQRPVRGGTITLPHDTPATREPWSTDLSVAGTGALGLVPGFVPGAELGFSATPPRLVQLRLFAGAYRESREQRVAVNSGARFTLAEVGLELCPFDRMLRRMHWLGCAGQALSLTRAVSFGFDQNLTTRHLTYAILAWTGLLLPLTGPLSLRFGARAELPVNRGSFTYGARDGSERGLFEASPVAAVLDAGLSSRL